MGERMLRNIFVSFAVILCSAVAVRAASIQPAVESGSIQASIVNGQPVATPFVLTAISTKYQDWGSATGSHPAGAGVLNGAVTTGLNQLWGDDANMVGAVGTQLTSMGFSVANNNAASTSGDAFGLMQGEIDFFRQSDSSQIGGFLWSIDFTGSGGLPGGSS